ncbi:MAG: ABC transporter substrate-binding protein [Micromonosporaceae bacterium]
MRRARLLFPAAVGVLALLAGACSSSGASNTSSGSGPEKTHIVVDTLPVVDAAPLFIAIKRGFFKQEGLTVTPKIIQASPLATGPLNAGTVDFSLLNYVSTFEIEESGVKFAIVADAAQGNPDYFAIMVPNDSPITSPAQLKGKKIAVPAPKAIGTLGADVVLKPYGVAENQVNLVPVPFPAMMAAFKAHRVDAATVVDPFITQMEQVIGAHVLADMMTGPMANFPIVGWGTVQSYVKKYPRTVAAFQRAMAKGQQIAATDRKAVEQIVPTYTQIPPKVATVMTMGSFPTTLSATRLQRVADLMFQFGLLQRKLDVTPILVAPPKS